LHFRLLGNPFLFAGYVKKRLVDDTQSLIRIVNVISAYQKFILYIFFESKSCFL